MKAKKLSLARRQGVRVARVELGHHALARERQLGRVGGSDVGVASPDRHGYNRDDGQNGSADGLLHVKRLPLALVGLYTFALLRRTRHYTIN